MNIGDVISKAWQTIWKHKVLWIFGIFAGCTSGGISSGNGGVTWRTDAPIEVERYFESIDPALFALYIGLAIMVGLLILVLVIFFSTIGRIGLIHGTQQSYSDAERITFGDLFGGSTPYFWRVFGLNLLVTLLAVVAIIGLILLGVFGTVFTLGLGLICLIPFLCLLAPILWMLSVYLEQAVIAIVIEGLGIMDGLRRGWEVFRENFGTMLGLGLILLVITLLVSVVIGLPFILTATPLIAGAVVGTIESFRTGLIATAIALICYLPFFLLLNGILRSYIGAAWTLNYLGLTVKGPTETEEEVLPEPA
ncbi:MAG: hypothetical protein U9R58_16035 [Chloroflexota bacterium]|nr:hypothetical protein [Chloroflexota bacterium]